MKSRKVVQAALISALAMPAGCQTTQIPSAATELARAAPFCAVAEPIYYSRADTIETIRQVREHNAVGVALGCGAFASALRQSEESP